MEKKNILFVNDEMTMGGVARILNTLLSLLDKDKYNIDLLILHKRGELLNEIPQHVNVISGSSFFKTVDIPLSKCSISEIFSKIRLVFYMKTGLIKKKIVDERKKILKKHYDIEFSAKEGFCTIFTSFGDSNKKLNWVQADYKEHNYSINHMSLIKEALNNIDVNIACSDRVMESFKEVFGISNVCVIHNPVDEELTRKMSHDKPTITKSSTKINLITVARFHKQKGLDRLISAYSKLKEYYHLIIIGDGELKNELYDLAKKLGCFDDIEWLGIMSNPFPNVRESDLFVMSSLYEGYPTMVIESLISGTPVLTTDVAGVKEQITSEYGWIVENSEEGLFNKLDELKESNEISRKKENVKEYHYNNQKILDSYYKLFNQQ